MLEAVTAAGMSMIGETILSASIEALFNKLTSSDLLNFSGQQVGPTLRKLQRILQMVYAALDDAEEKSATNRAVKIWLDDLRDLAFDVEDILDEFEYEAMRREHVKKHRASLSKIRRLATAATECVKGALFHAMMKFKIEDINTRLQEIAGKKFDLGLRENALGRSIRNKERLPSTSLVAECVLGREKDQETIFQSIEANTGGLLVIPLLGMGGVGKTTLAQLIYNDERVKQSFNLKCWACVSEDFDAVRVTATILQRVSGEFHDCKDLNLLQEMLKDKLFGKRFLIVLDDVWNENYEECDVLCRPFKAGAPGSVLIITTRNETIARNMGNVTAYQLQGLSAGDCLALLAYHALGQSNFDKYEDLRQIGEEIVLKRCKGLPLAVKALGRLLHSNHNSHDWEAILNNQIWDISEEKSGILPALKLSYNHLPSHLKQCFAYCSIFPKDYQFSEEKLILLWMAEGYLEQRRGNKQPEDFGHDCFQELVSKCFFQQSRKNSPLFVMHDLIHDLCQLVAEEVCFRFEDNLNNGYKHDVFHKIRYSRCISDKFFSWRTLEAYKKMTNLRTFVTLGPFGSLFSFYISKELNNMLSQLGHLRVLSLCSFQISELPDSVASLKHLRYLNLSHTNIKYLPESVTHLYKLQTLTLMQCAKLCALPLGIKNLTNLRHLDIRDTPCLKGLPPGLCKLESLQTLPKFIVGQYGELKLSELERLLDIRGEISILDLHNVTNCSEAYIANLKTKKYINKLELKWSPHFNCLRNEENEFQVLNMLEPHTSLKRLEISSYSGIKFPGWMGDPLFSSLVSIYLDNCKRCKFLPSLGQLPSLKFLHIRNMDEVERVGEEFYGAAIVPFQSLQTLQLINMPKWVYWYCDVDFPLLKIIDICGCPGLVSLPRLPSVHILTLTDCIDAVISNSIGFNTLTCLSVENISGLTILPEVFLHFLVALRSLSIQKCGELKHLWKDGFTSQKLACLQGLFIYDCDQLVSLEEDDEGENGLLLPPNLHNMIIQSCSNLERLPNGLHKLVSLDSLRIGGCPQLLDIASMGLPSTLVNLDIQDCDALEALPEGITMSVYDDGSSCQEAECCLQYLSITGCASIRSIPSGQLPKPLQELYIRNCPQLESVSERLLYAAASLKRLHFRGYPNLKSLPDECILIDLTECNIDNCGAMESYLEQGLHSAKNLERLYIKECHSLKSLPDHMQSLLSLRELNISHCPSLAMLIPGGGFLPNLEYLGITNCKNLEKVKMSKWGLPRFTSLKSLGIEGEYIDVVSFPHDEDDDSPLLFPPSLSTLEINGFTNLRSISPTGLQNIHYLRLSNCPQLQYLPAGGLPPTLLNLSIQNCPLMAVKCFEETSGLLPYVYREN